MEPGEVGGCIFSSASRVSTELVRPSESMVASIEGAEIVRIVHTYVQQDYHYSIDYVYIFAIIISTCTA